MTDFSEEDLARAIQESINSAKESQDVLQLDSQHTIDRSQMPRTEHHLEGSEQASMGLIRQVNTLNQFHSHFDSIIREFEAPQAICGYLAVANALIVARTIHEDPTVSLRDVELRLRDSDEITAQARHMMRFLRDNRQRYTVQHPEHFGTSPSKTSAYMSDWVANYEISDYLRVRAAAAGPESTPWFPLFLRFNEWPERGSAKHEELDRLEDLRRFGGSKGSKEDAAGYDVSKGESMFVVETFSGHCGHDSPEPSATGAGDRDATQGASPGPKGDATAPCLWTPYEFVTHTDAQPEAPQPRAFVLDVNGHFVAAAMVGGSFVVFNTTETNYLSGNTGSAMSIAMAFDLSHTSPTETRAVER